MINIFIIFELKNEAANGIFFLQNASTQYLFLRLLYIYTVKKNTDSSHFLSRLKTTQVTL